MSDSLISLGLKSSVLQSYFETQEKIKHLTSIPSPATQALIDQQESIRRSFEPLVKFDTTVADSLKFPKYLENIHRAIEPLTKFDTAFADSLKIPKYLESIHRTIEPLIKFDTAFADSLKFPSYLEHMHRAIEPLTKFDTAFADSLKFPKYMEEVRRTLDTTKIDSVLKLTSAFKAFEHASSESLAISLETPAIQSLYDHFKNTGDLNQWLSMAGSEAFGRVNVLDNTVVFDGIEISKQELNEVAAIGDNLKSVTATAFSWLHGIHPNSLALILAAIAFFATPFYQKIVDNLWPTEKESKAAITYQIAQLTPAQKATFAQKKVVFSNKMHVYETPKQLSKKVALLPIGAIVHIEKEIKDWSLVEFDDSESDIKITGWVLTRYLRKIR